MGLRVMFCWTTTQTVVALPLFDHEGSRKIDSTCWYVVCHRTVWDWNCTDEEIELCWFLDFCYGNIRYTVRDSFSLYWNCSDEDIDCVDFLISATQIYILFERRSLSCIIIFFVFVSVAVASRETLAGYGPETFCANIIRLSVVGLVSCLYCFQPELPSACFQFDSIDTALMSYLIGNFLNMLSVHSSWIRKDVSAG